MKVISSFVGLIALGGWLVVAAKAEGGTVGLREAKREQPLDEINNAAFNSPTKDSDEAVATTNTIPNKDAKNAIKDHSSIHEHEDVRMAEANGSSLQAGHDGEGNGILKSDKHLRAKPLNGNDDKSSSKKSNNKSPNQTALRTAARGGPYCIDNEQYMAPVLTLRGQAPWKCNFFTQNEDECDSLGDWEDSNGLTANEACCVCGGGSYSETAKPTGSPTSAPTKSCYDIEQYRSPNLFVAGCDEFTQSQEYCRWYGDNRDPNGLTAKEACCACGGGSKIPEESCRCVNPCEGPGDGKNKIECRSGGETDVRYCSSGTFCSNSAIVSFDTDEPGSAVWNSLCGGSCDWRKSCRCVNPCEGPGDGKNKIECMSGGEIDYRYCSSGEFCSNSETVSFDTDEPGGAVWSALCGGSCEEKADGNFMEFKTKN